MTSEQAARLLRCACLMDGRYLTSVTFTPAVSRPAVILAK